MAWFNNCENGSVAVVEALTGALDINKRDFGGQTGLMIAVTGGHLPLVRFLLDRGADPNILDVRDESVLMRAIYAPNNLEMINVLIKTGKVNIDQRDLNGCTALILAAAHAFRPIVEALVTAGANIHVASNPGYTALVYAVARGHQDVALYLLSRGALASMTIPPHSSTVLILACRRGMVKVVAFILDQGRGSTFLRLNHVETLYGRTALLWATEGGYTEVVRLLLAQPGVELNHRDRDHMSALSVSVENNYPEIAALLREAGAIDTFYDGYALHKSCTVQ